MYVVTGEVRTHKYILSYNYPTPHTGWKAMETCNGKNKYGSEHEAKNVRRAVLKARNRQIRIYQCPKCHGFHLTSEPKWHEPKL